MMPENEFYSIIDKLSDCLKNKNDEELKTFWLIKYMVKL